ncbi:hypothetical protein OG625_01980 [Streptomyces sp. NBC_01351]|uniref:hypothetical protein n=1 Tax=Streptomyces sp. NBC_01351 TaxID=2903833 RepID=UPI002E2FC1CB|nr:hypothetical protein [Streptomyces sp. NBC_01351]
MTDALHWQDDVTAGPGGAMTDEVGVVTGPLTLRTTAVPGDLVRFDVQYKDADEWYTLTGSPLPHHGAPAALHSAALASISTGHGAQAPGIGPG